MTDVRSIAVAQTCPIMGDVEANIDEHLRLARIAAAEGAQIVVFPELSLIGYELSLARDLAFSQDDPRLRPLIEASASTSVILVVGAPVRVGPRLHIGAFILRPDQTTMLYTKHHLGAFSASSAVEGNLPPAEASVFDPGDHNPLVEFDGNTAALAICADMGRPSHPQRAAESGARSYLASMFVIPSDFEADAARLAGYAKRHCLTVALANFGGPTGGLAAAGRSSIWSDTGELLVQLNASGAGVAVATETRGEWGAKAVMLDDLRAAETRGVGDSDYVSVATVNGPFEEAQICSFLQGNGIPARTRGEAIRKTHGITVDGIGAAEVEVPAQFAQVARDLIARADRGELRLTDDFDEDSSAR